MKDVFCAVKRVRYFFFRVLLVTVIFSAVGPSLSVVRGQYLDGLFWIDNKITFSNVIEPSRTLSILFDGGASEIADTGEARLVLPDHVTYVGHRVENAFGTSNPAAYDVQISGQSITLSLNGPEGCCRSSRFEIWIYVKTDTLDQMPEVAQPWSMPVSFTANLQGGGSDNIQEVVSGTWLYTKTAITLLTEASEAGPDDILTYQVRVNPYPLDWLTRTRVSISHPYGTDVIPESVSGFPGQSSSSNSLSFQWDGGLPGGLTGTFSVKVRDRLNLEFAEIDELRASVSVTTIVEPEIQINPVHVRSDKAESEIVAVVLPREPQVNMWFLEVDEEYYPGQQGKVTLNFFLKDEENPATIRFVEMPVSEDLSILAIGEVELPESFTLTPGEPRRVFEIPVHPKSGGSTQIRASVNVTESDGVTLPLQATRIIGVEEALTVSLEFAEREREGALKIGEEFTVRLVVRAPEGENGLTGVVFEDPEGITIPEQLEVVEAPASTAIGDLSPGEAAAFEWLLKAGKPGRFILSHHPVSGTSADGSVLTSNTAELNSSVAGFDVAVVLPEDKLVLQRAEEGGGITDGAGYQPLEFEVTVRVTVPENGEPIENITFQGFDASDGGLDIDLVQATGVESEPWVDVQPQPVPAPVWVSGRSPVGLVSGPLEAGGEPVEFKVTVTAIRPGTFDFAALITAGPEGGGNTITGRGNNVADIKGDVVLSMELEIVNTPPRITEGEAVEITGTVENVSLTETIHLNPLIVISSGQGVPKGPVALDDPLPEPGTPGIFNPVLEPGQRERFRLRVQTVSLPGFDQRYMGRTSVVIDFAVSGKVFDALGEERPLERSATVVEWGNGRHETDGAVFLRAQVDADLRPTRMLTQEHFFSFAAGNALENLARGGADAIAGIPNLLASIPPALWGLANFSGQIQVEKQLASHNAARYLWAWMDLQMDIWANVDPATKQQQLQLITDELVYYYGDKFESAQQVAAVVNQSITGYFLKVEDYRLRARQASDYGFNEELAAIAGEPFRPIGQFAVEEFAAAAAIASWTSRTARSTRILDEVAEQKQLFRARAAGQADAATAAMARKGDPRVTEMPDPMKALPESTPLTAKHAQDGWAVDPVSDRNLIRMTDTKNGGMPIFVAIRSRADETIEWMKTSLGITPKPMTFKPKNVNPDDVKYLGYRDGVGYGDINGVGAGDRGATIIAEPIPFEEVLLRLELDNADAITRSRVIKRHNLRWKEWYGVDCCARPGIRNSKAAELMDPLAFEVNESGRLIGRGTLDVPRRGSVPQPDINADVVGPGVLDARQFEMRQVVEPPDSHLFPNGRQYFECWLEDDLGTDSLRGVMRRIAGDLDTVAVGLADGSALPVATEFSETVAANLLHAIQAQHPWSNSLTIDKLFEEFVNGSAHRWHDDITKRGEPLIVYVNGERRVGWFHPTRTITGENPLKHFMWLDGGTADVDNVVRFQRDLRGTLDNPADVNPPLVKPSSSLVREAMLRSSNDTGSDLIAACAIETARSGGTLFRLSRAAGFERRTDSGSWVDADPTAACGDGGGVVIMPETFLTGSASPGDTVLHIIEDLLDYDWKDMFRIGDQVIIDPGTPQEEHRIVTGHGSLILDRPLNYPHDPTVRIVSRGRVEDDQDGDGLSDITEILLGTNPASADSDGDGREDFTEIQQNTSPTEPDGSVKPGAGLSLLQTPGGQWRISWSDPLALLEADDSLVSDNWTPVSPVEVQGNTLSHTIPEDTRLRFYRLRK